MFVVRVCVYVGFFVCISLSYNVYKAVWRTVGKFELCTKNEGGDVVSDRKNKIH